MDTHHIKDTVRPFLVKYIKTAPLSDDDDFFQKRFVNSLFAMQLVLFLEKEFRIHMVDADLVIDNFRSLNAIAALIMRKHGVTAEQPRPDNKN